jgi:hypothetical protein
MTPEQGPTPMLHRRLLLATPTLAVLPRFAVAQAD